MDLFSFPPIAATLDGVYAFLMSITTFVHPVVGPASAAVAVILLTLLVRTLLLPTGVAQAKADQTRARLAPKLRALQKKYRGDRERLQRETMQLYADEKASPLTGCAPVLIQAPIVGLVYALFLHGSISGHPNALLTEHLLGVPLGASVTGLVGSGGMTLASGAVFAGLIAAIAVVAEVTRRCFRPQPATEDSPLGGAGSARLLGALQFASAVSAVFIPLAAGLYLLTTVSWTLGQRLLLRRRYPLTSPPHAGSPGPA
ncbi:membrane protein insertase YidC [Microbacterium sp. P01]|uniref:membrane protein insertase YidC n=1 Tax=Microbacterium sp. P01 TaxID=3366261 RepID=UPI003671CBA6